MTAAPNVRHTLLLSFASNYATMALQFIASIVIARLLSPSEVGIFSIAAVMVTLASTVRDFGVGEYLIVEKELTHEKIRAAFAMNLMVSWGMGLLLLILAEPAAAFYKEDGVAEVLRVTAWSFGLIPFGAITVAWFRRQMQYKPVMIASIVSALVSAIVSVGLAYAGFSYMSLAWGSLAGIVTTVITTVALRPADFPRLPSLKGIRAVAHFGSTASAMYIFRQIGRSAPDLIIGRAVDMAGVGLYSRAAGLLEIFNRSVLLAVQRVALPYFAQENRTSGAVATAFVRATQHIVVISWPFCILLAILAEPIIEVLYGSAWLPAAPLLQLLALGFAIETLFYTAQDAILATGNVGGGARLQFFTQGLRILALLAAAPFGLIAICAAFPASTAVSSVVIFLALRSGIGLQLRELTRPLLRGLLVALCCGATSGVVVLAVKAAQLGTLVELMLAGIAGGIAFLLSLFACKHPLADEFRGIMRAVRARFGARKPTDD